MGLVGKFLFHCETGATSEVIEQVGKDIILVAFDRCSCSDIPVQPLTAINTYSLAGDINDEDTKVEIFSSRADLDAFMEWLSSPSEQPTQLRVVDKTVN